MMTNEYDHVIASKHIFHLLPSSTQMRVTEEVLHPGRFALDLSFRGYCNGGAKFFFLVGHLDDATYTG
jgi:hypothetical protein